MSDIEIMPLRASPAVVDMLCEMLIEAVAAGGSVSFMHPLATEPARTFWSESLAAAAQGKRVVLGAWEGETLIGSVTLLLDCPPNQPHRADIAKLMIRLSHRGRGIARALMIAAETEALTHRRTLLVLDTAVDGGASALYESLGFHLTGVIPDYALKPHGGLTGTKIYWKRIGDNARIADNA
jgi:ribosomal protein S18 acetylase RimI-like enzyme